MDSLNTIFLWTLNTIQPGNSSPDGEKGIGKNVTSNFQTLKWEHAPAKSLQGQLRPKPRGPGPGRAPLRGGASGSARRPGLTVALPELDGLVVLQGGRGDDVLRRVARRRDDDVCVALKLLHNLLGLQVPNVDEVVLRA